MLKCKRGKLIELEHYWVLYLFSKYNNKWWMHCDGDCVNFKPGLKKYKILVGMVSKEDEIETNEIDLVENGQWHTIRDSPHRQDLDSSRQISS